MYNLCLILQKRAKLMYNLCLIYPRNHGTLPPETKQPAVLEFRQLPSVNTDVSLSFLTIFSNPLRACLIKKKITFEAAYVISNMIDVDIEYLIDEINAHPRLDLPRDRLKELPKRNAKKPRNVLYTISDVRVLNALYGST